LDIVQYTDTAAGVPSVTVPPPSGRSDAPVVVAWHLGDPPRTEAGMAAALPLDGLDAWRVYLGLPLHGSRSPGLDAYFRLGAQDAVNLLFGPVTEQAVAEFPDTLATLAECHGFGAGPLAVVGGSHGSLVAQEVAIARPDVVAAVLVSPVAQLRTIVAANERRFGMTYPWNAPAEAIADRLDFVARAAETALNAPAVRIVVGADDVAEVREPAAELRAALAAGYTDPGRVDLVTVPGMEHALADEEECPLACAAEVDRLAVDWLRHHLR
jgi:pimeloyl-ACP methyl ester carboxylesterase